MSTSDAGAGRARPRWVVAAASGAVLVALLAGCAASVPRSVGSAPSLSVVTGLYPLAQIAEQLGGDKVSVVDVVPAGANPLTFRPATAETAALRSAGLVLEVGGGFQPAIDAAATGARAITRLGTALSTSSPYVWLDPQLMKRVVEVVAGAMESADPAAAPLYRQNRAGVLAEISSLAIDFSSTLSACPGTLVVTPDGAFGDLAADYGLHERVLGPGPTPAEVASVVTAIKSTSSAAVVSEPWVDNSGTAAVAAAAHVKLHPIDTLAGPPAGGWPHGSSYITLMEQNLATLSSALGCPSGGQ